MSTTRWVAPSAITPVGYAQFEDGSVVGVLAGALYLHGPRPDFHHDKDAAETVPTMVALGATDPALRVYAGALQVTTTVPHLSVEAVLREVFFAVTDPNGYQYDKRSEISRAVGTYCTTTSLVAHTREWAAACLRDGAWEAAALAWLAEHAQTSQTLRNLAENKYTPAAVQVHLARTRPDLHLPLARNPRLCDEAFTVLVERDDWDALGRLARKSTDPDRLEALIKSRSGWVRGTVGRNPACPPNALADLAVDEDVMTRAEVLSRLKREHEEFHGEKVAL